MVLSRGLTSLWKHRESIDIEIKREKEKQKAGAAADPVPEITKAHFEEAINQGALLISYCGKFLGCFWIWFKRLTPCRRTKRPASSQIKSQVTKSPFSPLSNLLFRHNPGPLQCWSWENRHLLSSVHCTSSGSTTSTPTSRSSPSSPPCFCWGSRGARWFRRRSSMSTLQSASGKLQWGD